MLKDETTGNVLPVPFSRRSRPYKKGGARHRFSSLNDDRAPPDPIIIYTGRL